MSLILLILLILTAPAAAQPMPTTLPLVNNKGETVGTATISGLRMYLRDKQGELFATVVFERDGTKTLYDPHGKVLDQVPGNIKLPQ